MKNNIKQNTIWEELNQTGLFLEGSDEGAIDKPINFYSGVNVSKTTFEPIDQIQFFIAAKRIQQWNLKRFGDSGQFIIFIGGLFEVLNATNLTELNSIIELNSKKELIKKQLYLNIIRAFNLNAKVLVTQDLWKNELYWNILKDLIDKQEFTRGLLMIDTLKFFNSKEQLFNSIKVKDLPNSLVNFPIEFIKKIGNWPAPLIYTPAEVAESLIINVLEGVTMKLGQAQERVYDKYLIGKISTVRLRQSVALNSSRKKSIPVTPYIDKEKQKEEIRLYFNDSKETLFSKLDIYDYDNSVYSMDPIFGQTLNPLVEKLIYAVESGICQNNENISILNSTVNSGFDVLNLLLSVNFKSKELKLQIANLINMYILKL